jgi:hypothetical protein
MKVTLGGKGRGSQGRPASAAIGHFSQPFRVRFESLLATTPSTLATSADSRSSLATARLAAS